MKTVLTIIVYLFLLFPFATTTYADGITSIHELNASPAHFDGKEVTLKGVTKDPTRIPIIDLKAYVLEDDSGEIIILTNAELPQIGIEITVRVRVESLAIIKGEALGTTVVELERYEKTHFKY